MRYSHIAFLICFPLIFILSYCNSEKKLVDEQPNIVLIMGDDIGFSDLGCFGSEIATPNLDRLANQGIRFKQFYNMSKCETTRSVMLTGHYTGDHRSVSIGELLKKEGYYTIHSGKEHFMKWVPKSAYAENAFHESYTFWACNEFFIPPDSSFQRPFILQGDTLHARDLFYAGDSFFKTDAFTDFALEKLDQRKNKAAPFFLYLPYGAAHYPLQARKEDIEKFKGKYLIGWDAIRQRRYEKMIELDMLDPKYKLSKPSSNINKFRGHPRGDGERRALIPLYRPWDSLTTPEKEELDLEMAVFAAMVHRMDYNIGRVINYLEKTGQLDNTLIMYLSDNGSCPYDSNVDFDHEPGDPAGYRTLSAAWANAGNTPFRYFKQFGHEGGTHTHFIAHWPDKIAPSRITNQPSHLVDLYPTILDAAGIAYPEQVHGTPSLPLHGSSIVPVFEGLERPVPKRFVSGYKDKFRMYREGDWKIVNTNNEGWALYNLADDLTEMKDLSGAHPEMIDRLESRLKAWEATLPGGKAQF
ncbi:MAG: arylsulfatase [Cytophagales bacterium]|nr:arylsulfatase [Cytophagales bacterium]